jgi:hypothetical protein
MIYTKEEIFEMDLKTASKCLKDSEREYRVEEPLLHNMGNWVLVDKIANQMLWLEDRIRSIQMTETAIQANKTRWANV